MKNRPRGQGGGTWDDLDQGQRAHSIAGQLRTLEASILGHIGGEDDPYEAAAMWADALRRMADRIEQ